jgi:thiamine biosynthesis lipoprotein
MSSTSMPSTAHRSAVHGFRFDVLGSSGRIRLAGVSRERAEQVAADAVAWLRGIEARLTRFADDSLVGRLNRAGAVAADPDLDAVLDAAGRAWRLTAGRFDATALPLWRLWHDPARTTWPDDDELAAARALVHWPALLRDAGRVSFARPGMAFDPGGVGKEWCVDRVLERLLAAGVADALVELGGDCAARGSQPGRAGWLVTLPGAAAAVALHDEALATSGLGTRRRVLAGREVAHLIDARSGLPAPGAVRSVTVLGGDCLTAGIHASDACLVARAEPAAIAARCGGLPSWVRATDGALMADPRLLARVHPIAAGASAA